jgi:hypothetical protein
MAAGEDEPQAVILDGWIHVIGEIGLRMIEAGREFSKRSIEARPAAHVIDGFESAGRDEPREGIRRCSVTRPLLHGGCKGIVQGFFRRFEIAEEPDQRRKDASRLSSIDDVESFANLPAGFTH